MTRVWYACSGIAVLIALALLEAALLLRLLNNRQQGTVLRFPNPQFLRSMSRRIARGQGRTVRARSGNPSGSRKTATGVGGDPPDFRATFVTMAEPGNRAANRLAIRFVIARWKAATRLLQNRTRRIAASTITSRKMTDEDNYQ